MYINWRERLNQHPYLWQLSNWPLIPFNEIPAKKRRGYLRNQTIVSHVLSGKTFSAIATEYNLSEGSIHKIMSRCLAGDDTDDPPLSKALIPHFRRSNYNRKSPLPSLTNSIGAQGAFSALLDRVPGLRRHLDEHILADVTDQAWGQNIKANVFHSTLLAFLEQNDWPHDCYPYTEVLRGYESCRLYLNKRRHELELDIISKHDREIRVLDRVKSDPTAYSEIQIDHHCVDTPSSVLLEFEGRIQAQRVDRISLLVARDVATTVNLSYVFILNSKPNQYEILICIDRIYQPWKRIEFRTPGFKYIPGAGYPSENLFCLESAPAIGRVLLDNALENTANSVRSHITSADYLGATFSAGIPKLPKDRNWIEFAFKILCEGSHMFKSTSGTGPADPTRESVKNSKKPPIISLTALEEFIEMSLANENAKPRATLKHLTPLTDLEYLLSSAYIPRLPINNAQALVSSTRRARARIHFNENGQPYINFCYRKYRGKSLYKICLNQKYADFEFDENDIRWVTVLDSNYSSVGKAYAPKSWQSHPHSTRTRKFIHDLRKKLKADIKNNLTWYFNYLLEHKEIPGRAREIVRVYREFTNQSYQFTPTLSSYHQDTYISTDDDWLDDSEFPEWSSEYFGEDDEDASI